MQRLTFVAAGCRDSVSAVAEVHIGLITGSMHHFSVLSDVCAAVHVAQPRQCDGAADGAQRHGAVCG
jgi:hypothetical protein